MEAVLIEKDANLNSKSEWGRNALTRLKVDEDDWHTDKKEKESENKERRFLHEFKEMKQKNISKAEGCPPATLRTNKGGLIGTESVGG